jgi:membrane-bound lytic murein transglycosylase D
MKMPASLYALLGFFLVLLPSAALSQSTPTESIPAIDGGSHPDGRSLRIPDDPNLPAEIRELMNASKSCYIRGAERMRSGEWIAARSEHNRAVDLLLESRWNIKGNPHLYRFFQHLLEHIREDESRFLPRPETAEAQPEVEALDTTDALNLLTIDLDGPLEHAFPPEILRTDYDIPIALNEPVQKSLNFWLTKGRKYFTRGIARSGRYQEMIERIFREESIPTDLIYLAQVESFFNPHALSRARAKGIWQFGKGTAVRYGLKVNLYIDERSDPEKSTRAAARYLKDLYAMFHDWNLVLAAYNWGEAKVARLIKRTGESDFWKLLEVRPGFPRETRNHVPRILAGILLAKNADVYGIQLEMEPPENFDRVAIPGRIDLRSAAKILGISANRLKRMNPALRGLYTPKGYANFPLNIPAGTDVQVARKVAALPIVKFTPNPAFTARHKVKPGETLIELAKRYGTTVLALQEANDIQSPRLLRAGTTISVPAVKSKTAAVTFNNRQN